MMARRKSNYDRTGKFLSDGLKRGVGPLRAVGIQSAYRLAKSVWQVYIKWLIISPRVSNADDICGE
jgi:hypothetical protein